MVLDMARFLGLVSTFNVAAFGLVLLTVSHRPSA